MKFLVSTRPTDGIVDQLPRPAEFEAQIEWVRQQLSSGRFDCAYHGQNRAVAIVNAESPGALEQLYAAMPLAELTTREVEPLGELLDQMQQVLESLRKFHARAI